MAASISKSAVVLLLLASSLLVLQFAEADHLVNSSPDVSTTTTPSKIDCGSACTRRCQLSSRPNLCQRACGTCCARCSCVPPGTAGNYEACYCYASLTTRGGVRKCP